MREDDFNLVRLELDRHRVSDNEPSQLAHQIESLAAASRTLETSLSRERTYSKQLREYTDNLISQMHFLKKQEKDHSDKIRELEDLASLNGKKVEELSQTLKVATTELSRYRQAWSQISSREKHANFVLAQSNQYAKRVQELELSLLTIEKKLEGERVAREKAEANVQTQRQELQSTLVRLHSSEARYNDMARELEAIHTLRKNHILEMSRVEQGAREKVEAQFAIEKEQLQHQIFEANEQVSRMRTDIEKALAEAEVAREKMRRELEGRYQVEFQRLRAQADAQIAHERSHLEQKLKSESLKFDGLLKSLGEESKTLRKELAQSRGETAAIEQNSRQVELELLRAREELASLQKDMAFEKTQKAALEESLRASEKTLRTAEKANSDLEKSLTRSKARWIESTQEMCELVTSDRRPMQRLIEKLITAWGLEDPKLLEALEALHELCEVKVLKTEAVTDKMEIVSPGSQLNC